LISLLVTSSFSALCLKGVATTANEVENPGAGGNSELISVPEEVFQIFEKFKVFEKENLIYSIQHKLKTILKKEFVPKFCSGFGNKILGDFFSFNLENSQKTKLF
jgi:hypothetical protein